MVQPSIEEQLAAYRAKKEKQQNLEKCKQKLWEKINKIPHFFNNKTSQNSNNCENIDTNTTENTTITSKTTTKTTSLQNPRNLRNDGLRSRVRTMSDTPSEEEELDAVVEEIPFSATDWAMIALKISLWGVLWKIAILYQWGVVYFIGTAFLFIGYNLRDSMRKPQEASAYSVFNPNCEQIDGTFTAEQFERELLHKM